MTNIGHLLTQLDLETKVRLLSGADMWSLPAIAEIGLRRVVMSDGPVGVRGEVWQGAPSTNLPSPTALAATWSPDLAHRTGRLLAAEARRKGVDVLLAPTVNLHRSPLGGRHFECYSEDPLLTGEIGAAFVTGVQDGGVAATVKHFVANDSETERMSYDVALSDRALRELYLAPFERIVAAGVWAVMASYNGVRGQTLTENAPLLCDVLKREWSFDGVVISDWAAARDTIGAALGGLDIAMPGPQTVWGQALVDAVRDGRVPASVVDEAAGRVLLLASRVGALAGVPASAVPPSVSTIEEPGPLARELATRSFVLAGNDGVLPLAAKARRIAVLGVPAAHPRYQGGGSAHVTPPYVVTPLQGLRRALPDAQVVYAPGPDPRRDLPAATGAFTARYLDTDGVELHTVALSTATVRHLGDLPVDPGRLARVAIEGTVTAAEAGPWRLSVRGVGAYRLVIDGTEHNLMPVPNTGDPVESFLLPPQEIVTVELAVGQSVTVELSTEVVNGPGVSRVAFTLGFEPPLPSDEELITEAVAAAREADVAVVVVGTTEQDESEGVDRSTIALPGAQDVLVRAVAAANPRTVVVVNAGAPVLLPWRNDVAAVLLTWFGGQEYGHALADVITGVAEPGGRLPTTWRSVDADPALVRPVAGRLEYSEDMAVGYRGEPSDVAYPFGHGLGYTRWSYLDIQADGEAVTVTVRNDGDRAGREIVQIYLSGGDTFRSVPEARLAGFAEAVAAPGQTVSVTVALPRRAFATWTDTGWQRPDGQYVVRAGRSAADLRLSARL